jgi:hypothetical protein
MTSGLRLALQRRLPRARPVVTVLLLVAAMPSHALDLSGTPWEIAASRHGLDPELLYAVAIQASGRPAGRGTISPWPWTIWTGTGRRFFATRSAALAALREAVREPGDLYIGLMRVDTKRHAHDFGDPATLLDARSNLMVAAAILAQAIGSSPTDPALGIGRYRYPHDDRAARAYGQRILRLREALERALPRAAASEVLDLWRTNAVLDLVAGPESRGNYNAWYRDAHQSDVQLADLTVNEVRALQRQLVRRNGGSAIGRYQIINDTLDGLVVRMGLSGEERFTPALQDRLAMHLARDAGLDRWLTGALSDARFAANMARVWAGLPAGPRNRSAYHGIQGNRAGIGWRTLVASLRDLRSDEVAKESQ